MQWGLSAPAATIKCVETVWGVSQTAGEMSAQTAAMDSHAAKSIRWEALLTTKPNLTSQDFLHSGGKGFTGEGRGCEWNKERKCNMDWPVIIRPINKDLQENLHLKSF